MDNAREIVLRGEYDLSDRDSLSALFGALRTDGPAVIDLTEVTYMDSTILESGCHTALASRRLPHHVARSEREPSKDSPARELRSPV